MAYEILRVEYYYTLVQDTPGQGYKILSMFADLGLNLLAFSAVPFGDGRTQLTLFPEHPRKMVAEAKKAGLGLQGPHYALLVRGDDKLGALSEVHARIYRARVNVTASQGLTDGQGTFAYLIYVRPEDVERTATALGI